MATAFQYEQLEGRQASYQTKCFEKSVCGTIQIHQMIPVSMIEKQCSLFLPQIFPGVGGWGGGILLSITLHQVLVENVLTKSSPIAYRAHA
jgi:hypothetical protein